ncbi:aminoglycoside phosphotransferase family protein [Nocardia sp. NBC_01377]|uniref:phosphotransferase n=1 Tax=Nocardia sp. NBC_01377 TaxID=2903595 RepID=UPI003252EB82
MATEIAAGRAAELHRIVELACARIGLDASGAELIKYTVNAVYRLPREQVVVRVASDRSGVSRGQRVVTVARWLQTRGAPIATLLDGDQPLSVDGYTVTFWRELLRRTDWSAADLATPLHHLHALELDSDDRTALPLWDPFSTARERLAHADTSALARADIRWLTEQWDEAEQGYRDVRARLRTGIIHGDPHTGNLLNRPDGAIVLCDLDESGIGPLAYDLVPQAVGATRFHRQHFYREFVQAYGSDVRDDSAWPTLSRIRELIMVTSVLPDLQHRPTVAVQHAHRLATLKAGRHGEPWDLYT